MPIYKPSELRQFLEGLGIGPRKGMSQNFLIDGNILRKIVQTANAGPEDLILEIGSGPGSLTELLLETGASVIAVEMDKILAPALERLDATGRLKVYCHDIMEFPIEETLKPLLKDGKKAKVIANLPYHLTTPILALLAPMNHLFSTLTLMVQDEVAVRFTSPPGSSNYSSFTIFLNFYSHPHYAFKVSRNCFYPPPKVDSAVVHLTLHKPPQVSSEQHFFEMTRTAFQQRRKTIKSSLKNLYPSDTLVQALITLNLNPLARPEDLSIDEFIALHEAIHSARDAQPTD